MWYLGIHLDSFHRKLERISQVLWNEPNIFFHLQDDQPVRAAPGSGRSAKRHGRERAIFETALGFSEISVRVDVFCNTTEHVSETFDGVKELGKGTWVQLNETGVSGAGDRNALLRRLIRVIVRKRTGCSDTG